eukprot:gene4759-6317_t
MAPLLAEKNEMAENDYPASWYAATRDENRGRAPLTAQDEADVAIVGAGFSPDFSAGLPPASRSRPPVIISVAAWNIARFCRCS